MIIHTTIMPHSTGVLGVTAQYNKAVLGINSPNTFDNMSQMRQANSLVRGQGQILSYISQRLFEQLFAQGLQLVTSVRKNMLNRLMPISDKLILIKRSIIETINDQLKNISQIEHSRLRSVNNLIVNLL